MFKSRYTNPNSNLRNTVSLIIRMIFSSWQTLSEKENLFILCACYILYTWLSCTFLVWFYLFVSSVSPCSLPSIPFTFLDTAWEEQTVFQKGRERKKFAFTVWPHVPGTVFRPVCYLPLSLLPTRIYWGFTIPGLRDTKVNKMASPIVALRF